MNSSELQDLRERIRRAEGAMDKAPANKKDFWSGYINALKDIRDDTQAG